MRFCTNMVSKGRSDYNLQARNILQLLYHEYIQISPHVHRELNKKIHQHKGSMLKVGQNKHLIIQLNTFWLCICHHIISSMYISGCQFKD